MHRNRLPEPGNSAKLDRWRPEVPSVAVRNAGASEGRTACVGYALILLARSAPFGNLHISLVVCWRAIPLREVVVSKIQIMNLCYITWLNQRTARGSETPPGCSRGALSSGDQVRAVIGADSITVDLSNYPDGHVRTPTISIDGTSAR